MLKIEKLKNRHVVENSNWNWHFLKISCVIASIKINCPVVYLPIYLWQHMMYFWCTEQHFWFHWNCELILYYFCVNKQKRVAPKMFYSFMAPRKQCQISMHVVSLIEKTCDFPISNCEFRMRETVRAIFCTTMLRF